MFTLTSVEYQFKTDSPAIARRIADQWEKVDYTNTPKEMRHHFAYITTLRYSTTYVIVRGSNNLDAIEKVLEYLSSSNL